jgi:hypothetical protein
MNDVDQFFDGMAKLAEDVDIPFEQLMKMRHSELQPLFEFTRIKLDLRIATNTKERDRLLRERQEWLDMHPLWRERLTAKRSTVGQNPPGIRPRTRARIMISGPWLLKVLLVVETIGFLLFYYVGQRI